jgi:hypothetical protein
MRWNIKVECVGEDAKRSTITLGTIERLAGSTTAENLGVNGEIRRAFSEAIFVEGVNPVEKGHDREALARALDIACRDDGP